MKKLDDKNNPLQPINHICDLLRKFLNSHSGFDRDNLQDYLNLFCFMHNGYKSNLERIDKLLNIALNKKVRLKYREMFKKRDNDWGCQALSANNEFIVKVLFNLLTDDVINKLYYL